MTQLVNVERIGEVAVISLASEPANVLSVAMLGEIEATFTRFESNMPRAVVVQSSLSTFAAGADVNELGSSESAQRVSSAFNAAFQRIAAFPRITIACVGGAALGGGCELALACDLRVASTNAKFGQPEILLGVIPGAGATQRLPRLVGVARAKELLWSGRVIDAIEALTIGLVDRVAEDGKESDTALAWATEFAAGPTKAQALIKRSIDVGMEGPLSIGLALEHELFVDVFSTKDAKSGVSSFLENGPGKATFVGE